MSDILYFLIALLLGYGLNMILIRFSDKLGAIQSGGTGNQVRWASHAKPLVGGIPFFIIFLIAALAYAVLNPAPDQLGGFMPLLVTGTLGFIIGLVDDAYNTIPMLKFVGQVLCGIILIAMGVSIQLFGIWWLDYAITLFWVVGIMNSFNMIDNMDGVSGSLSLGILLCTLVIIGLTNQHDTLFWTLTISMLGAHVAFLILNWSPSKLYMGDTGSQFLGIFLAFYGIKFFWNLPTASGTYDFTRQLLLPLLAFSMTIMDTTFVTFARLGRKQSPFVGGRDHITHHLCYLGMKERNVPLIIISVTMVSSMLLISTLTWFNQWSLQHTLLLFGYLGALFLVFAMLYRRGLEKLRSRKQESREVVQQNASLLQKA